MSFLCGHFHMVICCIVDVGVAIASVWCFKMLSRGRRWQGRSFEKIWVGTFVLVQWSRGLWRMKPQRGVSYGCSPRGVHQDPGWSLWGGHQISVLRRSSSTMQHSAHETPLPNCVRLFHGTRERIDKAVLLTSFKEWTKLYSSSSIEFWLKGEPHQEGKW